LQHLGSDRSEVERFRHERKLPIKVLGFSVQASSAFRTEQKRSEQDVLGKLLRNWILCGAKLAPSAARMGDNP
jgi:hypothetical protein